MRPLVLFLLLAGAVMPAAAGKCDLLLGPCTQDQTIKDGGTSATLRAAMGDSSGLYRPIASHEDKVILYSRDGKTILYDDSGNQGKTGDKRLTQADDKPNTETNGTNPAPGASGGGAKSDAAKPEHRPGPTSASPVEHSPGGFAAGVAQGALRLINGAEQNAKDVVYQKDQAQRYESAGDTTKAAQAYQQAGEPQKAEENYIRTLAREPKNAEALAGLAAAQAQQGRGEEAVETAQQALAVDPHNALAGLIVGHADEMRKGGSEAAKKLAKLDVGMFTDPGALPVVAPGRGGPQPEAPLYDTTQPLSSAQQLTLKALDLHKSGDDTGALLALTQAVDQEPENAGAFVVRAEVENALQSYPAAVVDAKKAVQLAPGNRPLSARALRAQAYAQLQTGDFAGALASASKSLELDANSGLGYLYRGMAYDKLGNGDAAMRDLAQAVSLDGSLLALAQPLLKKYNLAGAAPAPRLGKSLVRGGLLAGSLLLVLLGLLGTTAGRKAVTTAARSWRTGAAPAAAAPAELSAGDRLAGYRIVRELGRGGMGVVYEGLDETLQRRVAIKRMMAQPGADLERFLREARLVAQLKHPHVAEIYNVLDAGEPLLVFEFVEGRPLDQALREQGALRPAQARRVIAEVCDALSYAHGRQIIHRDLKPANVMLGEGGGAKVMDFGIAHQSTSGRTMTQTAVCGTPVYMAPEQGFGSVSKASDLYALAVMAYELLGGARPFDDGDILQNKLQSRYRPVTELSPSLPRGLDAFFARALAPDPAKRFASAAEFRDAFERALDGTPAVLS